MKIIARIKTDFPSKFGLPRQSGIIDEIKGKIIFEKPYRNPDAVRGLDGFSHIWLLWQFSESKNGNWSPTVRPPKLGGNKRMGVFATRSPFRPNPIGLSCVKLDGIEISKTEGPVLYVSGADLMDNTPIYDIKPYLPYADSKPDATGGFVDNLNLKPLKVEIEEKLLNKIPLNKQTELIKVLENNPKPSYQTDPHRIYGFFFDKFEISFKTSDEVIYVTEIKETTNND